MKRVTLQMIADRTGYSRNTVSCALRNHPSLPTATCRQIQATAREMGYRPDARLSELMTYLNGQRRNGARSVLAFVHDFPQGFLHPAYSNDPACFTGARRRAESLGYELEEFVLDREKMSDARLSRILYSRGIRGVLFGPMQKGGTVLELVWKSFCSVAIGFTVHAPRLHRVSNYQFYSLQLALRQVARLGYRRPGIWLPRELNARVNDAWYAAHALEEKGAGQTIPFMDHVPQRAEEVVAFVERHELDSLITFLPPEMLCSLVDLLRPKIPEELGVVTLHRVHLDRTGHLSGVDQQWEIVGAAAIDMLVGELNLNHLGLPQHPKTLFVEGCWVDAQTTRLPKKVSAKV